MSRRASDVALPAGVGGLDSGLRSLPRVDLHVASHGRGPTLVLVHGFGANGSTWRHWVGPLAGSHRVLVVDLKGFGRSPKPPDPHYGPAAQARLLLRTLRDRGETDVTLVGHSLGGGVCLLATLLSREGARDDPTTPPVRVRRMVLVSSAAYPQKMPRYIALIRVPGIGRFVLALLPARWLTRRVLRRIVYDPAGVTEAQVRGYADPARSSAARRALIRTARSILPTDLGTWNGLYPGIDVPVLLLWGRQDPVVPLSVGHRLADALPRARLEILDRCGHVPPEELPLESLEIVLDFLRDHPVRPRGTVPEVRTTR